MLYKTVIYRIHNCVTNKERCGKQRTTIQSKTKKLLEERLVFVINNNY